MGLARSDIRRSPTNPAPDEDERVNRETKEIARSILWDIQDFGKVYNAISSAQFSDRDLNERFADVFTDADSLRDLLLREVCDRTKLVQKLDVSVKKLQDLVLSIDATIPDLEAAEGSPPDRSPQPQPSGNPLPSEETLICIRFLFLADLHRGQKGDKDHFPTVQKAFFDAFERIAKSGWAPDLLLFAGDYVNLGTDHEFTKELPGVLKPLWDCFGTLRWNPMLIGVPGNHDLQRPTRGKPVLRVQTLLENWSSQSTQAQFWDDEQSYLRLVEKVFGPYQVWWKRCRKSKMRTPCASKHKYVEGLLPGDFSCSYKRSYDGGEVRLGIVALNTAFLQLISEEKLPWVQAKTYREHLSLHVRQFNQACDPTGGDGPAWAADHDAVLLLTHHPMNWLEPSAQESLRKEIYTPGRFLAHLYGHMHVPEFEVLSTGGVHPYAAVQAPSLYGEEKYYDTSLHQHVTRSHGFYLGEIQFTEERVLLRVSPYILAADGNHVTLYNTGKIVLDDSGWAEVCAVDRHRGSPKKELRISRQSV